MTDSFSLVTQPWIPVINSDGAGIYSLRDLFTAADNTEINTADALERAAIHRLLLAIHTAATTEGTTAQAWLDEHADDFDILHPDTPFAQNPKLAAVPDADWSEIHTQLYDFSSTTGSPGTYTALGQPEAGAKLTLAEAARLLLVRQMFSAGGLGPRLGKYVGAKATSFQQSLHYNLPFMWISRPGVQASIVATYEAITAAGGTGYPIGTFWFGLFAPHLADTTIEAPGVLDMLTYPSRSLLLRHDGHGHATHLLLYEGMQLPRTDKTNHEHMGTVFRHTTWWSYGNNPATPRGVRTAEALREDWQHIMDCYATEDSPSILSPQVALPDDANVEITALAGDKSRIDNVVSWRIPPARVSRENALEIHEAVDQFRRSLYGLYSVSQQLTGNRGDKAATVAQAHYGPRHNDTQRRIILAALAGAITPDQCANHLGRLFTTIKEDIATDMTYSHPHATTRLLAHSQPQWITERTPL